MIIFEKAMKRKIFVFLSLILVSLAVGIGQEGKGGDFREDTIKNFILSWYGGTNDHVPKEKLLAFLSEEVEFFYPDRPAPVIGKKAFVDWYENALKNYFDETHYIEKWKSIEIRGERAEVAVVVRWEYRTWKPGEAKSEYHANLAHQRWEIGRDATDGRFVILKKIVEQFDATAPIFGVGQ